MRHLPLGVELGRFLIIVGVALLVFKKSWTAWATPRTPMQFIPIAPSIKTAVGRLITVALGLVFVVVGASAFLPIGPGRR